MAAAAPSAGDAGPVSALFAATGFQLEDWTVWTPAHATAFCLLVVAAFAFLNAIVPLLFSTRRAIPARGRHHDVLDVTDTLFLSFNRVASVPFTYHYLRAAWMWPAVKWCATRGALSVGGRGSEQHSSSVHSSVASGADSQREEAPPLLAVPPPCPRLTGAAMLSGTQVPTRGECEQHGAGGACLVCHLRLFL